MVTSSLKESLITAIREEAYFTGDFVLSSGKKASFYIDLRKVTLSARMSPIIGILMRELTSTFAFTAVGGLTLGADPIACAMMHAPGTALNAFTVRKTMKEHGMAQRIEGPSIRGKEVLIVDDTSTTGNSVITAVEAAQEVGAKISGVATILDRGTRTRTVLEERHIPYCSLLSFADIVHP